MDSNEVFPPEIMREILLKATVKSLLRCKSVCKKWYRLISGQHFIKTHYTSLSSSSLSSSSSSSSSSFIFNTPEQRNILKSCPLYDVLFHKSFSNALLLENPLQLPPSYDFRIAGSCNGLLLLVQKKETAVFIYNPATRRLNCMPLPIEYVCSPRLYSYGFGYDEVSSDYKVVVIIETGPNNNATRILSLNSGEWKEGDQFPCAYPNDDGKFLNGALHWEAGNGYDSSGSWKIVSLDLANETYGEVSQPEYHERYKYLEFGVAGEWLCVLGHHVKKCVANVWVLKVYGVKDSWTKLASIPYPDTWKGLAGRIWAPFYISEHGKIMLKFGRRLVIFDSKDTSSSSVTDDNSIECLEASTIVESLESPFGLAVNSDDEDY